MLERGVNEERKLRFSSLKKKIFNLKATESKRIKETVHQRYERIQLKSIGNSLSKVIILLRSNENHGKILGRTPCSIRDRRQHEAVLRGFIEHLSDSGNGQGVPLYLFQAAPKREPTREPTKRGLGGSLQGDYQGA